tara:strand:- start:242 stop:1297 length:1056 start_codon:yes stop_codon:yes gene_type:complete
MVRKLKDKPKSQKVVDKQFVKLEADAEGLSVKEFNKQRKAIIKSQQEYQKTHWVADLTDTQLHFIATTPKGLLQNENEEYYMGKPLSRSNLHRLTMFKQTNKGYLDFVKSIDRVKQLKKGIEKPLEPFKKLQQEYQEIGKRLRSTFAPERKLSQKVSMGIGSLFYSPEFENAVGLTKLQQSTGRWALRGLLSEDTWVEKSHGLNTLMKKRGFKSPLDIADHFLAVMNNPSKLDYYVENYDNCAAFAKACGVFPAKVFELIAREIKKRKSYYKEQALIVDGVACEELVNEWNTRRTKNETYPYSEFFNSKFRKDWTLRWSIDWSSYKRFHEAFPKWIRIFNARATKKKKTIN